MLGSTSYLEEFFLSFGNILGGKLGQFGGGGGGEVELFGGEAFPAPPSLDETLPVIRGEPNLINTKPWVSVPLISRPIG